PPPTPPTSPLSLHDALPICASRQQVLAELRLQAAGERDHTLGVGRDLLDVDRRLAPLESLEESSRRQLDQVAIAGVGGGQQRQVDRKSTRLNSSHVKISYAV